MAPRLRPAIGRNALHAGRGVAQAPLAPSMRSRCAAYRSGNGGRRAPSKPVVIGRYGPVTADQARRKAPELLGKVAGGNDPTVDRAEARGMPTLGGVFEGYMAANPKRTNELYRYEATAERALAQPQPLNLSSIGRDVTLQSAAL